MSLLDLDDGPLPTDATSTPPLSANNQTRAEAASVGVDAPGHWATPMHLLRPNDKLQLTVVPATLEKLKTLTGPTVVVTVVGTYVALPVVVPCLLLLSVCVVCCLAWHCCVSVSRFFFFVC